MESKFVIATFYQLGRFEGKSFSKDNKKALMTDIVVERDYAERINSQWENSGKLYVINEKKTEEYQKKLTRHIDTLEEARQVQEQGAKALTSAVTNALAGAGSTQSGGAAGAKSLYAVDLVFEMTDKAIPVTDIEGNNDYQFSGTKKECEKWIKDNKPTA